MNFRPVLKTANLYTKKMTTVILAEKPSQARDIAKVIGIKASQGGVIELVNGWKVTNAFGHLLELAEPQAYDESWGGRWSWAQQPMLPTRWKSVPVKDRVLQLRLIKGLLSTADTCILATDAGREGELIGREILEYCKFKGTVKRFWTSSLTEVDIRRALDNLKPNAATLPLYEAGLARSHSDWLLGIPVTRAATLAAKVRGDYFPVGRVKTPTLAMVVRRDLEIASFGAKTYFELEALVRTARGAELKMVHAPNEENRITDKEVAKDLLSKASRARGPLRVVKSKGTESAPLPYSLPNLQKDANRAYGFSAKRTLELAQILYETKKMATYPRTDCSYLAESQVREIDGVLAAVAHNFPEKVAALRSVGTLARSTSFNDAKLSDHHAIIPTGVVVPLDGAELQLYTLIAHRYMQAIAPDYRYDATKVTMDANGVLFKASGVSVTDPGWKSFKAFAKDGTDE